MLNRVVTFGRVNYFFAVFGAIIYGLSLGLLLSPNNIAPGGIAGISVMVSAFVPVGVGTLALLLNIPLLIASFIKFGMKFLSWTLICIFISSVVADFCQQFVTPLTIQPLLAAVAGGGLMGIGVGMCFRGGATTGGTDIISKLIKLKKPYLKTSTVMLAVDGIISMVSGLVFRNFDFSVYSLIALVIFTKVLDMVLYGTDSAKLIFVITTKKEEIANSLLKNVNVGCTLLDGRGAYSSKDVNVIICVVKKQAMAKAKSAVLDADDKAFMLVTGANEIFGEGFKSKNAENY